MHKKPKDRTITLFGKRRNIRFVKARSPNLWHDGQFNVAIYDAATETLYVRYTQPPRELADCIYHELLHASCPTLFEAEDFVTELSTTTTQLVFDVLEQDLGYRRNPER